MNSFKKNLSIFFSLFLSYIPLNGMYQNNQTKIFVLPYALLGTTTFVFGGQENGNSTWKTFEYFFSEKQIKDLTNNFQNTTALKIEIAKQLHQQTLGAFAYKEKKLKDMQDLKNGIIYFLEKFNDPKTNPGFDVMTGEPFELAIIFIKIPFIPAYYLNEQIESLKDLPHYRPYLKKTNFQWVKINELHQFVYDPDLAESLKDPDFLDIIKKLK